MGLSWDYLGNILVGVLLRLYRDYIEVLLGLQGNYIGLILGSYSASSTPCYPLASKNSSSSLWSA